MQLQNIIGHKNVVKHLIHSVEKGRIPHAQLFVGPEGAGVLSIAIAFARAIICNHQEEEANKVCQLKFDQFSHPDLHFIYPTVTTDEIKTKPKSFDFLKDWRKFLIESPYGSIFDWYKILDVKNKQGEIRVEDAQEILKTLSLKAFEGGNKVMLIWMADKMNIAASNKLLKLLEEPTDKTFFILITEKEEDILQTIRSRCQVTHFGAINEEDIIDALIKNENIEPKKAQKIALKAQGNYNKALQLSREINEDREFEEWFVTWVRAAFRAKGNAAAIQDLILWSENIAALGRETQKQFLHFCIDMFRQALLLNYETPKLVYLEPSIENFNLEKFAPFVNGNNINDIFTELSNAVYHIERNGNAKIILTDLSIKLTRFIHKK